MAGNCVFATGRRRGLPRAFSKEETEPRRLVGSGWPGARRSNGYDERGGGAERGEDNDDVLAHEIELAYVL